MKELSKHAKAALEFITQEGKTQYTQFASESWCPKTKRASIIFTTENKSLNWVSLYKQKMATKGRVFEIPNEIVLEFESQSAGTIYTSDFAMIVGFEEIH